MIHILVAAAMAATPASGTQAPGPVRLASPGFSAVNVDEKMATFISDHFANQLTLQGLRVVTASEIGAMIGFERQKELLGCTDSSSSCMAEIAAALGVDALIVGSLGKFDTTYQVNLKIVSTADAAPLSAVSVTGEGDRDLLNRLNEAARKVAVEVSRKLGREVPAQVAEAAATRAPDAGVVAATETGRKWPLLPTIGGGALVALGGFALALSFNEVASLREEWNIRDINQRTNDARWQRGMGIGMVLGGASLIGGAAYMYLSSDEAPPAVTAAPVLVPGGAGVGVAGALP